MNKQQFKDLLEKQKQNKLSDEEKVLLTAFETILLLKNKEHVFADEIHKKQIQKSIKESVIYSKSVKNGFNWSKNVASIILLISIGISYSYYAGYSTKESSLNLNAESITLESDNGNIQMINENGLSQLIDAKGNIVGKQRGSQLVYNDEIVKETLEYNILTIPYGKRFKIRLSDGTSVHLNAGSSLKYPIKFISGKNRQVFLKGEAFFDVAKDIEHPFIVNANEIDVKVLGTQFNVSSYPEDNQINTVLIEGSVNIYKKEESYNPETATNLKPGFKATWQKGKKQLTVEETDTQMHTAWISGAIIFRRVAFKNIIKKLERHYNVVIINNNESLNNVEFGARFDIETIEQVFETLNENYNIDYRIEENKIIIN